MDKFFNSAIGKPTANFSSESPAVLHAESTDTSSYAMKCLKKKLKIIKESHSFAKETGNAERAKSKIESIESIED